MDFLKRAQKYTEVRGDEFWFSHIYTGYREHHGVEDSVWMTLNYLYGKNSADLLFYQ